MPEQQSRIKVSHPGEAIVIVIPASEVERTELADISEEIRDLINAMEQPKEVVCFEDVHWMPTMVLGNPVALNKSIRQRDG